MAKKSPERDLQYLLFKIPVFLPNLNAMYCLGTLVVVNSDEWERW